KIAHHHHAHGVIGIGKEGRIGIGDKAAPDQHGGGNGPKRKYPARIRTGGSGKRHGYVPGRWAHSMRRGGLMWGLWGAGIRGTRMAPLIRRCAPPSPREGEE